jgi:LemA protein
MEPIWIVLIILVVLAAFVVFIYNGLIQRRNVVDEAWNQISVQLKRRHDLIPNLVNAVKGYMDFEQETLTKVIEARGAAVSASQAGPAGAAQSAQAENFLTGALRQLFALVENYPDLKANQNVLQLQEELTTTENQIGFARQHYNSTVRDFNTSIQTFPSVIIAGMFGFKGRDYFQIEEADAVVPTVNLRDEPPQSAPPAPPQAQA